MNVLVRNWHTVKDTASALSHGGTTIGQIPLLLSTLLKDEAWREFVLPDGEVIEHARFADFVIAHAPRGLGSTVELVRKLVSDDKPTLDLLDQALQNPPALHNVKGNAPTGNAEDAALRRLRKDAPELHAEVLAGALSAHAAMVRAGFRPRTLSVPLSHPERVAAALRRHMSTEDVRLVAKLLAGD